MTTRLDGGRDLLNALQLPPSEDSMLVNPVTLPPGRTNDAMKPSSLAVRAQPSAMSQPRRQRVMNSASDEGVGLYSCRRLRPNDSAVERCFAAAGPPVSVCLAYLCPHAVAPAHSAGRVHPALPPNENAEAALRRVMVA